MVDSAINTSPDFGFRNCIGSAWLTVRDHWFSLLSAAFLRELVSILAAGVVFAAFIDWRGWNLIIAIAIRCLVWSALQAGYLKFCLNICDRDKVQWHDLFSGLGSGFQMLIATACLWCVVGLGLVFLVVPGLFLAVRFSLYGFALVDQKVSALKSLVMSHHMLKGFGWCAAGVVLIYCVSVGILGWLSGVLEPLMVVSLCMLYRHIRAQEASR